MVETDHQGQQQTQPWRRAAILSVGWWSGVRGRCLKMAPWNVLLKAITGFRSEHVWDGEEPSAPNSGRNRFQEETGAKYTCMRHFPDHFLAPYLHAPRFSDQWNSSWPDTGNQGNQNLSSQDMHRHIYKMWIPSSKWRDATRSYIYIPTHVVSHWRSFLSKPNPQESPFSASAPHRTLLCARCLEVSMSTAP